MVQTSGVEVKNAANDHSTLAGRIRSARRSMNATQQVLAGAVGVSRPAISQWEGGETKDIKPENLLRACHFLMVRPEWLVFGDGPMRPGSSGGRVEPAGLAGVIEGMERTLAEERLLLAPAKKAELVAMLYEMFDGSGEVPDQSTIVRLARLAA